MADEIKVVGLSGAKGKNKPNAKLISAVVGIIVLSLGVIAGILLIKQQQDLREKAAPDMCPESEACPDSQDPSILRNCHPPENDGTSQVSVCSVSGRVSVCGGGCFECDGTSWISVDANKCVVTATPTPPPLACDKAFNDDFSASTINTTYWEKIGDAVLSSGRLVVTRNEAGTSNQGDGLKTKNSFSGDFVIEVDIPEVVKNGGGGGFASIVFLNDVLSVNRGIDYLNTLSGTGNESEQISLPSGPVTVKIVRKSGKFSVYYKTGENYTLLKNYNTAFTGNVQGVFLSAFNTGTDSSTVAKYDNFKVSCEDTSLTPTPTATATATGAGNKTATPTITPTGAGNKTATPTATATGVKTATPTATSTATGVKTTTPTATSTSINSTGKATSTASSAPVPVTGINWPTAVGMILGILMIAASALAL